MKAPLPADEDKRQQALQEYAILDTPPERDFDEIAELAAQICGVPVALISLVDKDRQWFKSKVGLEVDQTPREYAFCAHVINRPNELLVVTDATKDQRFADNPFVTEPNGIRFYAGAPLVTPSGYALGTLCVFDRVPRDLEPAQRRALEVLSRHVMTQLRLRRQLKYQEQIERELRESENEQRELSARLQEQRARLLEAQEVGRLGSWETDFNTLQITWSEQSHRIFETDPKTFTPSYQSVLAAVHEKDREWTEKIFSEAMNVTGTSQLVHRIVTPSGKVKHVEERWRIYRDENGKPVRAVGTCRDITAACLLEEENRQLVRKLSERIKELQALYRAAELLRRDDLGVGQVLRHISSFIPEAMKYPEVTQVRASYGDETCMTAGFQETPWKIAAEFVAGGKAGRLEVSYREERPAEDEGLFYWEERSLVNSLAEMLRAYFERQAASLALHNSETSLADAQAIAHLGSWELDFQTGTGNWSAEMSRLFYRDPTLPAPNYAEYCDMLHPDDRGACEAVMSQIEKGVSDLVYEHRTNPALGPQRRIRATVHVTRDETGRGVRATGTALDVTESYETMMRLRQSEERFRLFADTTNDAIWDLDLQLNALWWSEGFHKLFGYPSGSESSVEHWRSNLHPEDRDRVLKHVDEAMADLKTETYSNQYRFRRADGEYAYVRDRVHILRDASGRPIRLMGGITDLTVIKQAEQNALHHTQALMEIVVALQEASAGNMSLATSIRLMTEHATKIIGVDGATIELKVGDKLVVQHGTGVMEKLIGESINIKGTLSGMGLNSTVTLVSNQAQTDERVDRKAAREFGVHSVMVAPMREDDISIGVLKVVSVRPAAFSEEHAANLQILAESFAAIIQRRRFTDQVRASEERYRLLFANNPQPMWVVDCETLRFLAVNETACRQYGYTKEEFLKMTVVDIRVGDDVIDFEEAKRLLPVTGRDFGYRMHRMKDGRVVEMEIISDGIEFNGRRARLVLGQNVTDRRQSERKLREQAALLDKAQDAILVRDLDHRITYWNKSAERLYRWKDSEAIGRSARELLYSDPSTFDEATQKLLEEGEWIGELEQKNKAGEPLVVEGRWTLMRDAKGRPASVLAINTDITERKKLEQQFLRAQRLESIGTLAGGIAHDLNNLLAPITLGVQLLRIKDGEKERRVIIDNIERSARRGAELVKQVMSFARGVEGARVAVYLKHVVREVEAIIENTFPKNIRLEISIPPDLWLIMGDPTQLNQVLLNLCVNARDAMPHGGRLQIVAENVTIDKPYAVMNRGVEAGPYVKLEVTDTGTGIPPELLERIFDPFFTTKEQGKGTGLGLATLQGIVRSYGGFVNVYSELGKGTTFKVYLPAQNEAGTEAPDKVTVEMPRGHGEWILVVDDENSVVEVTKQTLEAFGYRVYTASDGAEAISVYAMHRDEIAAVLTDMMMPVMDGPALIAALRRINPRVRVIAASGLSANDHLTSLAQSGVKHFLPKPFTTDTLLRMLRDVLEEGATKRPF